MFLNLQITVFESSAQNPPYAGTFLISAHPIVDSDRACLELLRFSDVMGSQNDQD